MYGFNQTELEHALMEFVKRVASGDVQNPNESRVLPSIANLLTDIYLFDTGIDTTRIRRRPDEYRKPFHTDGGAECAVYGICPSCGCNKYHETSNAMIYPQKKDEPIYVCPFCGYGEFPDGSGKIVENLWHDVRLKGKPV